MKVLRFFPSKPLYIALYYSSDVIKRTVSSRLWRTLVCAGRVELNVMPLYLSGYLDWMNFALCDGGWRPGRRGI